VVAVLGHAELLILYDSQAIWQFSTPSGSYAVFHAVYEVDVGGELGPVRTFMIPTSTTAEDLIVLCVKG
jgi:hypothetical protein